MSSKLRRAGALLAGLICATSLFAVADLTGRVASDSGAAIADATVFVYTAGPKVGTSPFCPSCYPDCGKSAKSDADGQFSLPALSTDLRFQLLVVAKGYVPKFVPRVEPGADRVDVALRPRGVLDAPPERVARGRVVDATGAPVHGAVVEIRGAYFGDGRRQWGGTDDLGIDPMAVTDEAGDFEIASRSAYPTVMGRITARAFADRNVELALGKMQTLTLAEGATLSGRVVFEGKPLANVSVGVSGQDRAAGDYAGHFEIGTDAQGRFTLTSLRAKTDYYLYGLMETVGRHGMIAARPVHVGRDGSITDVGDLTVRAGHRLSGRVVLEDGAMLPGDTRLLVRRDTAWDSLQVVVAPDGEFDVAGIPPEIIELSLRVQGYQLSAKNKSYEAMNRRLAGRMSDDVTGLVVLLEKIPPLNVDLDQLSAARLALPRPPSGERPRERPLRGAEAR